MSVVAAAEGCCCRRRRVKLSTWNIGGKKRAKFSHHPVAIMVDSTARLRQSRRRANLPLSPCEFFTVTQSRSNWVEAPLARLRSAGEVATDFDITLKEDEGVPFSVIAGALSTRIRCRLLRNSQTINFSLPGRWVIMVFEHDGHLWYERKLELIPTNCSW